MKKMLIYFAVLYCCFARGQDTIPKFQRKYPTADSLLKCLGSYHTDSVHLISLNDFSPKINVTDSVKRKILSLLKHEWTPAELKKKVAVAVRENFEYEYFGEILNKSTIRSKEAYFDNWPKIFEKYRTDTSYTFSKRYRIIYDSVYNHIYDSTLDVFKKDVENKIRQAVVPDEVVLVAAIVGIKEALPIIQHEMAANGHFYASEAAVQSMAILGDSASQLKIFKKHQAYIARPNWGDEVKVINGRPVSEHGHINNDVWILSLIHTQESFALLADWMDTTKRYAQELERGSPQREPKIYFYADDAIATILYYVQNKSFKEGYIKQPRVPEQIEFIKRWMLTNKGKYELADLLAYPTNN